VTAIEKQGNGWMVSGLKDPKAHDPVALLREDGMDPAKVRYRLEPFLSLDIAFAADRELESAKAQVEKQLVRFDSGSSRLPIGEARQVEELAATIGALFRMQPGMHIVVTGRADDVGTEAVNEKLSRDRTASVIEALVAQGLPAERLESLSLSNAYPLRVGESDWDKAANRSVSFRVKP